MKPSISCWRIRSSKTSPSRVASQFALSGPTAPTPCRSCLRIPIGLPGTSGASVRVIVSSHLARRADRQKELLEVAEPYDLIILDEAHHARRRGAGSTSESGPNALLKLMRVLKERTQGLVLLTATPMQVHPVEVFDLLSLLGLPPEWTEQSFLRFFDEVLLESPSHEAFDRLAGRHCHVAKGRTRHFTTSRDVRPLRPRSATWSSPQREARGAFGLRGDGVGR